jgi:Flagellar hook-length control protein FliK
MSISVNPIFPVIAAQGAAPDLVLQPGSVVDALVLKILSENLVRIAIAGVSVEVLSEIPLSAGQSLQLAVSRTPEGIRLAVAGPDTGAGAGKAGASMDTATLAPNAVADAAASPTVNAGPPRNILTPLEQVTVAAAAETAATQQGSQAPLFANLDAVLSSGGLPPKLQQAVIQVLAQRLSLDRNLTGSDVRNAFQKSGLFLEASLASGSVSPAAGIPDLKAALIVLRQTLLSSLGVTAAAQAPAIASASASVAPAAVTPQPVAPVAPEIPTGDPAAAQHAAETPTLAPSLSPDVDVQEILLPLARVLIADDPLQASSAGRIVLSASPLNAGPRAAVSVAALNLLQEIPSTPGNASLATSVTPNGGRNDDVTVHTNTPPPPFRGALPSAQPVAAPSIASAAPLATTAHHLLGDTDAAIARQTLLQVASLPDRVDIAGVRIDPAAPRWNFEIPFAMPQGTAMAQFEISRDGGGNEVEAAKRIWRARFSLDVEPAGPVHALVSLIGDRTSVRMWAERPATAARLRAGAAQLSQALSKAELLPGDIVIREGAPSQSASARAGHFVDRAS